MFVVVSSWRFWVGGGGLGGRSREDFVFLFFFCAVLTLVPAPGLT